MNQYITFNHHMATIIQQLFVDNTRCLYHTNCNK